MTAKRRFVVRVVAIAGLALAILLAWSYVQPASALPGYTCNPSRGHGDPGCHTPATTAPPTTSAPPQTTARSKPSATETTSAPQEEIAAQVETTTTTEVTSVVASVGDGSRGPTSGEWIALLAGVGVIGLVGWIGMAAMWKRSRRARTLFPGSATGPVRFVLAERLAHWVYALCFVIAGLSGALMWIPATRQWMAGARYTVSQYHGYAGLAMVAVPLLIFLLFSRRRLAENARELSSWDHNDRRWLLAALTARMFRGKEMPPQRRFNAGQKVNSHLVAGLALGFLATGIPLLFFRTDLPWWLGAGILFAHEVLAVTSGVLLLGHLFMALLTRHGRAGLHAMTKGIMPASAAREGHSLWYAEWLQHRAEGGDSSRA